MAVVSYVSVTSDPGAEQARYESHVQSEFYQGHLRFHASRGFLLRVERGLWNPVRVLSSRQVHLNTTFQRSWTDIGNVELDLDVLWFVRRGCMTLNQDGRESMVRPGECMLSHSRSPFVMRQFGDEQAVFETLTVIVPGHMLRATVGDHLPAAAPFSVASPHGHFAATSFQTLLEVGSEISVQVAQPTVSASLAAIEHANAAFHRLPRKSSLARAEARWSDVETCVASRFSDRGLTAGQIAGHCRVSTRRLCQLAAEHGTTISELLWRVRLNKAREWLESPKLASLSAEEIARRAGFKSASHFSRRFKRQFGLPPSRYSQSTTRALPVRLQLPPRA